MKMSQSDDIIAVRQQQSKLLKFFLLARLLSRLSRIQSNRVQ